jgi:hypothetical protein
MPAGWNQLAPPELLSDGRVWSDTRSTSPSGQLYPPNADAPDYQFGNFQQLPTAPPQQTYTGAIQIPPNDYAATSGNLPNDYYHMLQFMNQAGPNNPQLNQMLQLLYLRRQGRT